MKLSTDWIVGFTDGEGCFTISVNRHKERHLGFQIQCEFVITQSKEDIQVLYALKNFFNAGSVQEAAANKTVAYYRLRGLNDHLTKVIPFFDAHSLKTRKQQEYLRFKEGVLRLQNLREKNQTLDKPTLIARLRLALKRNRRRKDQKARTHYMNLLEELGSEPLEDRVQRLAKAIRPTERNSLPSKFWPARKA